MRVLFDEEVELPQKFWVAINFNPHQTKGVYLSYDTSTKGEYSRVGLPGDDAEQKETAFGGDWMVQEIPWWVGLVTHLVFGWTMAVLYPLGRYVPYDAEPEIA